MFEFRRVDDIYGLRLRLGPIVFIAIRISAAQIYLCVMNLVIGVRFDND